MNKTSLSVVVFSLLGSFCAFAGQQSITFDDMKMACMNPAKFHNQIAPSNIQVSCRDVQIKWIPDTATGQNLDTYRQVSTSMISDKYATDTVTSYVPSDAQAIVCPTFKQITETVDTIRPVTCQELLTFKGTATDFCTTAVNSLRFANPDAVVVQDTGQVLNLCNSDGHQYSKGPGQGQGQGGKKH